MSEKMAQLWNNLTTYENAVHDSEQSFFLKYLPEQCFCWLIPIISAKLLIQFIFSLTPDWVTLWIFSSVTFPRYEE